MATTEVITMLVTTVMETMMEDTTQAPSTGLTKQEKLIKASNIVNQTGLVIIMFSMGCVIKIEDLKVTVGH